MDKALTQSPISCIIRLDAVPRAGISSRIEADAEQMQALARDHELLELRSFEADVSVTHWRRDGFALRGRILADIVQQCSVTLEPIPQRLDIPVEQLLVPENSELDRHSHGAGEELLLSADSPDEPETFTGNRFDIGALIEEFFALALDPYPRLPGVAIKAGIEEEEAETASASPFERLRELGSRE